MSDEIHEIDSQSGITMAWHQKTRIPKNKILTRDFCFPYNTEIVEFPNYAGGSWAGIKFSDGHFPGKPNKENEIGRGVIIDRNTYTLRTNHDDFDLIQKVAEGTDHEIVSSGTVKYRTNHFVTLELNLEKIQVEHREFGQFLNLLGSIDGSTALIVNMSSTCSVCNNTVRYNALIAETRIKEGKGGAWALKHSKNMEADVENLKSIFESIVGVSAEFELALKELNNTPIKKDEAAKVLTGFLVSDSFDPREAKAYAPKTRPILESAIDLFSNGRGNEGKSRLDLLSAVTELKTEGGKESADSKRTPLSRWQNAEYGSAAKDKENFGKILVDSDKYAKNLKRGTQIVDLLGYA